MSKGARMALVAGVLAAIAIVALAIASNQTSTKSNDTSNPITNQADNATGKKVTIDLNENLGLKEKP